MQVAAQNANFTSIINDGIIEKLRKGPMPYLLALPATFQREKIKKIISRTHTFDELP